MARLNEILVGRFNRSLQKLFGIKGGPPVATVSPEIMPVHAINSGVENHYLESWSHYMVATSFGALAANANFARIRNPAASNIIAVIEQIEMSESTGTDIFVHTRQTLNTDLTGVLGLGVPRLDARGQQVPTCVISTQQGVGLNLSTLVSTATVAANTPYPLIRHRDEEIPLLPGDVWQWSWNAVNVATFFRILWRERFLEESERT